jgi:hypothetical protein
MIINSTLIILIVFGLVFLYLYWNYEKNQNNSYIIQDKFSDSSLLVEPDTTFVNNNNFTYEIEITEKNITNLNNAFSKIIPNLQASSDRMALSKLINDKIYKDNLTYNRDKSDSNLIYKLYKRPANY